MSRLSTVLLLCLLGCAGDKSTDSADGEAGADADGDSATDGDDGGSDAAADACGNVTAEGWTAASHEKGVDGNYALVFDDTQVMRIDLVFCPEDRDAMLADLDALIESSGGGPPDGGGGPPDGEGGPPTTEGGAPELEADPIYVPVTVAVNGQTWPQVGIRYKGNSSLSRAVGEGSTKLPFRLHFDKYEDEVPEIDNQRFHGFQELKFSNAFLDPSLQRDKLTADLMREVGVPAAKGGFVEVWADGGDGPEYWGLYAMFEDPAGELLDSWFENDDGAMYKADGDAATLADDDLDALAAAFEGKVGGETHEDLAALVQVLNDGGADREAWRAELEAVLDVEGVLAWLAMDSLIGNWDQYGQMTHNYYLYANPEDDDRFAFVPWDFNESWNRSGTRPAHSVSRDEVGADWPLIRVLLDDPVYQARYGELLADHLDGPLAEASLQARMTATHELLAPFAAAEWAPYSNLSSTAAFETSLDGGTSALFDVLADAHALGDAYLGR